MAAFRPRSKSWSLLTPTTRLTAGRRGWRATRTSPRSTGRTTISRARASSSRCTIPTGRTSRHAGGGRPTTFIGTDGYDGLTTCVSVNTAVAARVGKHRVTYEPNLSGVPDPSGLQLRIDGALTALSAPGIALGSGGRVAPSGGGGLEVDFPDGKTLLVTPAWWASQAKWYLNVDVSHGRLVGGASADAGRGLAGALPEGSWLPALPNGASMGPMPATLPERYTALYRTFADAWRVSDRDSLFDYAPGTSTATFTRRDWPKQTLPCEVPETKPTEPASEAVAEGACRRVTDPDRHADCVFDVRVTGNLGFAKTYLATQRIFADATTTSLDRQRGPVAGRGMGDLHRLCRGERDTGRGRSERDRAVRRRRHERGGAGDGRRQGPGNVRDLASQGRCEPGDSGLPARQGQCVPVEREPRQDPRGQTLPVRGGA